MDTLPAQDMGQVQIVPPLIVLAMAECAMMALAAVTLPAFGSMQSQPV